MKTSPPLYKIRFWLFFLLSRLFKNLFLRTIYDTVRRLVKRRGRPHKTDSWFCTLADDSGATDWNRCKKSPKPMSLWESVKLIFSLLMLLYHKVRHKNGKWASICKGHGLIHTCKIFSISNSAAREQVYIYYLGKTVILAFLSLYLALVKELLFLALFIF